MCINILTQHDSSPCSSLGIRSSACWPSPKASGVVRTAVAAAWTMARPGGRCLHILHRLWPHSSTHVHPPPHGTVRAAACAVACNDATDRTGAWPAHRPAAHVAASRQCPFATSAVPTPWPVMVGLHKRSFIIDETCNLQAGYVVVTLPVTSLQACRQPTRAPSHLD